MTTAHTFSSCPGNPADHFISQICEYLASLKTKESNRWAPLIKGNDQAGIALQGILQIAFSLCFNIKSTARFFKKGVGGKRNRSTAIFNLVDSLIKHSEINTQQLDHLARSLTPLNKTLFPTKNGNVYPRYMYLYQRDYEVLMNIIEKRKTSLHLQEQNPIPLEDTHQGYKRKSGADPAFDTEPVTSVRPFGTSPTRKRNQALSTRSFSKAFF
jgi:hypothetical protein